MNLYYIFLMSYDFYYFILFGLYFISKRKVLIFFKSRRFHGYYLFITQKEQCEFVYHRHHIYFF